MGLCVFLGHGVRHIPTGTRKYESLSFTDVFSTLIILVDGKAICHESIVWFT